MNVWEYESELWADLHRCWPTIAPGIWEDDGSVSASQFWSMLASLPDDSAYYRLKRYEHINNKPPRLWEGALWKG